MKKSKLLRIVFVIILSLIVFFGINTRDVFAANIPITDLTGLTGNSTTSNNIVENNTTINSTTNNSVLTTNNTSNYNNTSLPNTGIESSMPAVMLLVVFGISAIYAYKKMQDYKSL